MTFYVKKLKDSEIEGPYSVEQINERIQQKNLLFGSLALEDHGRSQKEVQALPIKDWKKVSDIPGFVPHPDEEKSCLIVALMIGIIVVLVVIFGFIKLNSFLHGIT